MTPDDLTPNALARLRAVAEKASPGPWTVSDFGSEVTDAAGQTVFANSGRGRDGLSDEDEAFINSFHPLAALALLSALDRGAEEAERAAKLEVLARRAYPGLKPSGLCSKRHGGDPMPAECGTCYVDWPGHLDHHLEVREQLRAERDAALADIARLRAEVETLKRHMAEDDRDVTELETERDRLRAELAGARACLEGIARGPRWATGDTLADYADRAKEAAAAVLARGGDEK